MLHRDNYSILLYERLYHNKKVSVKNITLRSLIVVVKVFDVGIVRIEGRDHLKQKTKPLAATVARQGSQCWG